MMAASGSGGNNLMTYHEFVAAEQLQQAAEGKTKNFLRNKQHSTIINNILGVASFFVEFHSNFSLWISAIIV